MECSSKFSDFDILAKELGLGEAAEVFRAGWARSQASYEIEGDRFLNLEEMEGYCRYIQMSEEAILAIQEALGQIHANVAWKRLLWHVHYRFYFRQAHGIALPETWPDLPVDLGPAARLFYALVLLPGLPLLQELHRARGIEGFVTVRLLSDFELWMRAYRKRHGVWGIEKMEWLARHFEGRVFHLGRLQFELRTFDYDFRAFRNRHTEQVAVLAGPDQGFRGDGLFQGSNGIDDTPGGWVSEYEVGNGLVQGNPVAVDGRALHIAVTLPLDSWDLVLEKGDPCLGVHIPATGPMEPGACQDAFEQALRFFPKHFPELPFRAFDCDSWLLDPQLEDILPPSSNIVRFLRRFCIVPSPGASDEQTLERVFEEHAGAPLNAPMTSLLRKGVADHMRKGGRWHNPVGLLFPEDVNRGGEFYRSSTAGSEWAARR